MRGKRVATTAGTCAALILMGSIHAGGIDVSRCQWDLNGDREVGVIDMLDLLGQWGTDPGTAPDFNHDGVVDTIDFLELLRHWGPCER